MNTQQDERIRLIGSIGEKLVGKDCFLGTAESCTGGLVAKCCTDMAGSSAWFKGGVVSYSNGLKELLLGVGQGLLAESGAVSEAVVTAMALGALERLGLHMALATSGIAGPDGGTREKPVGTVWMAVAFRETYNSPARVNAFVRRFAGDREAVREQAATAVLRAALDELERE
ncbi:CinA family protein [Desulfovibrio sp. OttesenSCG-928-G15]|nr:CinA family protein [Desulfovibrio sp. OttesenSCG-928-G15]